MVITFSSKESLVVQRLFIYCYSVSIRCDDDERPLKLPRATETNLKHSQTKREGDLGEKTKQKYFPFSGTRKIFFL